MKDSAARRWFSYLIVLIPVGVLLYALVNQTQDIPEPKAKRGEINLTEWDFIHHGSVRLNGEWMFAWKERDMPAPEFNASLAEGTPMLVPGIWNGKTVGENKLSASGYGTYRLKVFLATGKAQYAINIRTMSNAYRFYINGKLVAGNGVVSEDPENAIPQYKPEVITFVPDTNVLDISVRISNYDHCKGGFWLPVELGSVEQVQNDRDARVLTEMFLFGCLFMMALYHFGLYVLRSNDLTALFFGLMCTVISVRSLLTGEILMNHIFPGMDWHLARKIEYILTFMSPAIYVAFCRKLFPQEWNKMIYRSIVGFGIALCLFVLFTPTAIFTNASYVFTGYAWIVGVITIWVFVRAFRKKLDGAGIFLATTLFFLLTIVNDTLNQMELVHTGLYLAFGLLIVTFAQSFSLSSRFSDAFFTSELYAKTFRKFVPSQFLDRIAKDGIQSIKPGNAEKAEVTVLFSDIRSFTTLAETMTPDEVFSMLNKYLAHVEPPIRANHGFVDKYMGDGIMALFEKTPASSSATNAIRAALQMHEALRVFNDSRNHEGKAPLEMGIGLHTGPVIIGTLGGSERMDSTAIGDAVNLASRIEGMTKMYGTPVLVSEFTLQSLGDQSKFRVRYIDDVIAKGKNEPLQIWQVIGKIDSPVPENYSAMLITYAQAIALYKDRNIVAAQEKFEECISLVPGDKVSGMYLERCRKYLVSGGDVSGAVKLEEK